MERIVYFLAPILTSIQMAPQVYKTYKLKDVSDLSLNAFILMWFASVTWFLHGYYSQDVPVMASSSMTFIMSTMILWMMRLYG